MLDLALKCEQLGLKGSIEIEHRRDGKLLSILNIDNLKPDAGKAATANVMIAGDDAPTHIAYGTGTTPAAASDQALDDEVKREAADRARITTTVTNDTAQYTYTFTLSATINITEAGLLNRAEGQGGSLFSRQVFTAIPCLNGDTVKITFRFQAN